MKLELGKILIHDICFAEKSEIRDGVLYVSKEEMEKIVMREEGIQSVSFDIAKPGESVRITPVKDVIEPRVKVEGPGGIFPEYDSPGTHAEGTGRETLRAGLCIKEAAAMRQLFF